MNPIVALYDASGVIHLTQDDSGTHGEDGTEVDGLTLHRIYSLEAAATLSEFINRYVWSEEIDWWQLVPVRPNAFAFWNINLEPSAWDWSMEEFRSEARFIRDEKLFITDWMILPDSPLSEEKIKEAKAYRQALRDFPATLTRGTGRLEDIAWPIL